MSPTAKERDLAAAVLVYQAEARSLRSRLESAEELTALKQGIIEAADTRIRELASQLDSAERERDLMRPVVLHARRWYHSIGTDHDLGVEVPRYENLTVHSPTPTQGGANG